MVFNANPIYFIWIFGCLIGLYRVVPALGRAKAFRQQLVDTKTNGIILAMANSTVNEFRIHVTIKSIWLFAGIIALITPRNPTPGQPSIFGYLIVFSLIAGLYLLDYLTHMKLQMADRIDILEAKRIEAQMLADTIATAKLVALEADVQRLSADNIAVRTDANTLQEVANTLQDTANILKSEELQGRTGSTMKTRQDQDK